MNKKATFFGIMAIGLLLCGCKSGMYSIDFEDKSCDTIMPYCEVDSLDADTYTADCLPVKVFVYSSDKHSDNNILFSILTVGVIPAFFDDYETRTMVVETPIGTNTCQGTLHAKSWLGWLCFIPYPGTAALRTNDPDISACPQSVGSEMRQKMLNTLVSRFKKEEYDQYYKDLAESRKENERLMDKIVDLSEKLKEGKYDEVISACNAEDERSMKNAQWAEFVNTAIMKTRDSILQIQDVHILLKLFEIYENEDRPLVGKIVLRLAQLKGLKSIDKISLREFAFSTTNEQARAAAMREMDADEIRDSVWRGESTDIMVTYINVFGTDDEMTKIAESYAVKLTIPEIMEAAKSKSPNASNIIKCATANVVATRVYDNFVIAVSNKMDRRAAWSDDPKRRFEVEFYLNEEHACKAMKELCQNIERADENIRSAIALAFVNKLANNNLDALWVVRFAPEFVEFLTSEDALSVFDMNITESACEDIGWFKTGDRIMLLLSSLAERIPKKVLQERYDAIIKKAEGEISFGGYYCYMSIRDFIIVGTKTGILPDEYEISARCQNIQELKFNNRTRYQILRVDDDKFWSTFISKYDKSLFGDSDYRNGQWCRVYKSTKRGVKVFFGEESGFLAITTY